MNETTLTEWNHFHDWYLDRITIGTNTEPRTLTLGLYLGDKRVALTFEGVTCVSMDNLGLLNIVNSIRIIKEIDKNYSMISAALDKGERLTKRKAVLVAYMFSSLGAELAIEFDSLFVIREAKEG